MSSFRALIYTELRSAGFTSHGGGSCAPCSPLTIVEFVNGPFTRQPGICSCFSLLHWLPVWGAVVWDPVFADVAEPWREVLPSSTVEELVPLPDVLRLTSTCPKFEKESWLWLQGAKRVCYCAVVHFRHWALCCCFNDSNWLSSSPGVLRRARCCGENPSLCLRSTGTALGQSQCFTSGLY